MKLGSAEAKGKESGWPPLAIKGVLPVALAYRKLLLERGWSPIAVVSFLFWVSFLYYNKEQKRKRINLPCKVERSKGAPLGHRPINLLATSMSLTNIILLLH